MTKDINSYSNLNLNLNNNAQDNTKRKYYGIDVSEHNGIINWQDVRVAGIQFVIIRLGYGRGHLDSRFYANVNGALNAGLNIGVYYYSYGQNFNETHYGTLV